MTTPATASRTKLGALPANGFAEALAAYRKRFPRDGYYSYQTRFEETYKLLQAHYAGGTILDVGGWPGDFACALASLDVPVMLLDKDVSRPVTKQLDPSTGKWILDGATTLQDRCSDYGIETVECDIEREALPLDDNSVDLIVFTEVIEHLRIGLLNALREMNRVLRPGGKLLLSTPNLLSLQNRLCFLVGSTDYDTLQMPFAALAAEESIGHGGHFRVFSMPELIDLLSKSGFDVVSRHYEHLGPDIEGRQQWSLYNCKMRIKDWVAKSIGPLGNSIFIVAVRT